ncbi:MAG TPA: hypothetical protein VF771_05735, partial [Longimicrobiaceae bacterium]
GHRNADGSPQGDAHRTVVAKLGLELFVNQRGGRTTGGGAWVSLGTRGDASQLWWDNVLAVDPFDPGVILTGQQELYRTGDGGATWSTVATYYSPHEDQQSLVFDPANRGVAYLSNDGGVFRSTDSGRTWYVEGADVATEIASGRSLVKGLVTAEFYKVGVQFDAAVGNLYHSGIIGSTAIGGSQWAGIEGHAWEFRSVYSDPRRVGRFYVFHGALGRRRFPGTGNSDFVNFGEFTPYDAVGALAVDTRPGSNIILVCAIPTAGSDRSRLMMTTEGDREPRVLADGTVVDQPAWTVALEVAGDAVASVRFAPATPGTAYAMSAGGRVFRKDDIDAADAWAEQGRWAVGGVLQMAVNALHSERLYAITQRRFARSTNGGTDWTETAAASLPPSEFHSLIAHPTVPEILFLGATVGVFASHDEGRTWAAYDEGLPNAAVQQIFTNGSYLYAITHGRGLWRRQLC